MVAAGIPDRIIMKIVGHTTPNRVSRYAHLAPDNLKGAIFSEPPREATVGALYRYAAKTVTSIGDLRSRRQPVGRSSTWP